jgi:putative transposase
MTTYTRIIYQIVFGTKYRAATLDNKPNRDTLFKYISGIIQKKECHLYQIGGVEDHLHIVTHLHPGLALASLVKDIKMASADYIKRGNLFPKFGGWQSGYGAFTYSMRDKDRVIEYVKHQEEHHRKQDFKEEYVQLLQSQQIEYDEKYLI